MSPLETISFTSTVSPTDKLCASLVVRVIVPEEAVAFVIVCGRSNEVLSDSAGSLSAVPLTANGASLLSTPLRTCH